MSDDIDRAGGSLTSQQSAQIFEFPVGGRRGFAANGNRPVRAIDASEFERVPLLAVGDSWYHQAAIDDDK